MNRSSSESESEPTAIDRAIAEYLHLRDTQPHFDREQFLARYPDLRVELAEFIDNELNAQHFMQSPSADLDQTTEYHAVQTDTPARTLQQPGQRIPLPDLNPYRLTTFLGEGGMGRVYEAVDASGQHVAIKVLNQQWSNNPESMERFKQEGALAGTINHPRCVFVRAVDEVRGQPFIVMELMSGKTLKDLVLHSGPLSPHEAVSKILDVIEGLQEAHVRGVIHRDIKPANCFLEPTGRVKLGDFGLARSLQQESDLTQSGSFIGTPLFASPEQIRGEQLDFRTDIYSVCATLYYLLTGQAPFGQYSSTQVIARIVSDDPAPIRSFNPAQPKLLEQVLQKGLSRNRDRRFQDLNELKNALIPFVSGRQAIAQLARRLAAHGFDTCLLTLVLFGLATWLGDAPVDPASQSLQTVFLYHGIAWAYFILFEGFLSATPGKLALQLRVVDSRTGERARFRTIVLRAAIYLLISSQLPSLAGLAFPQSSSETQLIAQLSGSVIGMALLSVTLRPKYGSRLLHDVLSNTIVVAGHNATQPVRLLPAAPLRQVSTTSAAGWPSRFGAYDVSGVIWQTDQQALLCGRDARLNRDVWLLVETGKPTQFAQIQRGQSRPTRLRYLSHGEQASMVWTAFVAPTGAPLRYWVTPERPLSWRETQLILEQLIEELRQSREDDFSLNLTSLDQLWLDAQGRISLVDWSLNAPANDEVPSADAEAIAGSQPPTHASLRNSERSFALEVMRMCLTGKSRPLGSSPVAVETPLPVHARNLLERLRISDGSSNDSFDDLLKRIRESATRPWVVGPTVRLWMIGISLLTTLGFVGAMMSISRIGNQAALMRLEDSWIEASALQAIATNDAWFQDWQGAVDPQLPERQGSAAQMRDTISDYKQACRSAVQLRWKNAGVVLRQILADSFLARIAEHGEELQFERVPGQALTLRLIDNPSRIDKRLLSTDDLKSRWQALQAGELPSKLRRPLNVMAIVQIPFAGLILWSALARGGLPFLLLGVCIVRRNGALAGRWLVAWRAFLSWLPMILLNGAIVALDLYWPELGWLATMLHLGMLGLLPIYTAIALRWPDCGPQDWLAGTRLVPA